MALIAAGFWFLWAQFPPERAVWLGVVLPFAVAMGLGLVLFGAAALRGRGPAAVACTAAAALAAFVLVEQGMITRAPLLNPWPAIAAAAAPHLTTSDRLVLVGRAADGYNFANFYLDEPVVGVHAGADLEALWQRERVLAVVPAEDRDALIRGLTPAAAVLHVSPARLVLIANWNPSAR